MSKTIKVFSPATIGNIGPGFDVLGLAVKGMGDIVEVWNTPGNKIIIEEILNADHPISKDPDQNTAGIAAREVLRLLKLKEGIGMRIVKGMPAGSGLGSSAASAEAAAYAVNLLFDEPLSKMDLILPATLAEEYVSGAFFCRQRSASAFRGRHPHPLLSSAGCHTLRFPIRPYHYSGVAKYSDTYQRCPGHPPKRGSN